MANPFTLTGTKVTEIGNTAQALSARTHRIAAHVEHEIELWYKRDSLWHLFPLQPFVGPDTGLVLTQAFKQPATLGFTLPDPDGNYASENLNSTYNYNGAGAYDPLLDEARKIVLRVGAHCYSNLASGITPTSTLATSGGSSAALSALTDGVLDTTAVLAPSLYCHFNAPSASPFTLIVDLGSSRAINHAVIRFATLTGTCTLPSSVQVSVSVDSLVYRDWPARPVGGAGSPGVTPGDWDDSASGNIPEFAFCDLQTTGRYVKFTVTPTGAQTIWIDELAVYGGSQFTALGGNLFTGYMGDQIDFSNAGLVKCVAVDALKKLADNNDVFLTAPYRLTSAGGVELGDIVHSLLTSTAYWNQSAKEGYNDPLLLSEIAWSSGSGLTGLQYPLWQGQTNSILGYCQELFAVVGWNFLADGNGTMTATEPPYTQKLPDRVCVSATDGNYDVYNCQRHRTGKNMRNRVIVQTGKSKESGSGSLTLSDPNSIARFGTRTTRITDPLAATTDLRLKVAQFFLRDYAWNLQTLTNTIRPTFETALKQIFGFRAPARPNLFSRPSTVAGAKRNRELWSLVSVQHNITYGQWTADAEWVPYVSQPTAAPNFTQLNIVGGDPTELTAIYDIPTDPLVVSINVYLSTTSEFTGFSLYTTATPAAGARILGPGLSGQVWVYLTSVDAEGNESLASAVLSATPGSISGNITCYTITDFTIGVVSVEGPDAQGYYTYQFLSLHTAPGCGFTQGYWRANLSVPADLDHGWLIGDGAWHWWAPNRILQGREWDNVTFGQLDFTITMRTTTNLSGVTLYWQIWNSVNTRSWKPVRGNHTSCVIP